MSQNYKTFQSKVKLRVKIQYDERLRSVKSKMKSSAASEIENELDLDFSQEAVECYSSNGDCNFGEANEQSKKPDYVTLNLLRKIFQHSQIAAAADTLRLTDNQLMMILSSFIKAGNCSLHEFDMLRSTVRRTTITQRKKL